MIERKEPISDIANCLGQLVLKGKANLSRDCGLRDAEIDGVQNPATTEWIKAFKARVAAARNYGAPRTQAFVADLLRVSQTRYSKWETRDGSTMPVEYMVLFCAICRVSYEWLLTGIGEGPAVAKPPTKPRKRRRTPAPKTRAA